MLRSLMFLLLLAAAGMTGVVVRAQEGCPLDPPLFFDPCEGFDPSVTCIYGELCCPGDEGCGNPEQTCTCNEVFGDRVWGCQQGKIFCPDLCPASQPSDYEPCDLANSYCNYGEICCGDDCIDATTCTCSSGLGWSCFNNTYTDPCPEVCPVAKPAFGASCDIDTRFVCSYDQGVCASLPAEEYAVQCSCRDSAFECFSSCSDTVTACPEYPLSVFPSAPCDLSVTCGYGELCCPGEEGCGNSEWRCDCLNGSFECTTNRVACQELCPEEQPSDFSSCDIPSEQITCSYGEDICCGNDCIPGTECYCDPLFDEFYCFQNEYTDPCPLICPEIPPSFGESCDIDRRLVCSYPTECSSFFGDPNTVLECKCVDGIFECYDFCNDVIFECPAFPPSSFLASNLCNFMDPLETCNYGSLCCPGNDGCDGEPIASCSCDDGDFVCDYKGISCPELCPATTPEFGDPCDVPAFVDCSYGEVCCGQECIPRTSCQCVPSDGTQESAWSCTDDNTLDCTEAPCPETRPVFGESCDIDTQLRCYYDEGTCGVPTERDPFSTLCLCEEDTGAWRCINYCTDKVEECPEVPNSVFVTSPCEFSNPSVSCEYGETCCPGDEGCGVPRYECQCGLFSQSEFACTNNFFLDCTCDDDREARFYVPSTGKMEPCVWLAARPEMQAIHCDPQDPSNAYSICAETCGKCIDDCKDDPVAYFEYEDKETYATTLRNCLWLSLRNWIQDEVCDDASSQAGTVCPETCNKCDG